jgi:hypothetical protein
VPKCNSGHGQPVVAYPSRMPAGGQSPVPPADGIVTDERLGALLALAAEYDDLDFKLELDLSSKRSEVELVKDVGAMQVKGGHIVIGVDGAGVPTGDMDGADTTPFDPANLVPKMQRFLEGPLGIASSVLTKNGHKLVLISIAPNPHGCAFFQIDAVYPDPQDPTKTITRFRAGDVFWRENTRSIRINREGFEEIIERRFAARRDELLREWAAAQLALATGEVAGGNTASTRASARPRAALADYRRQCASRTRCAVSNREVFTAGSHHLATRSAADASPRRNTCRGWSFRSYGWKISLYGVGNNRIPQRSDAGDLSLHDVTGLQRSPRIHELTAAPRRAGQQHVARLERHGPRAKGK